MPMPTYEDIMQPFLKILEDGQVHSLKELQKLIADYFNLTEEERNRLLPSGNQRILYNRSGWARTHLKKAELISYVKSGQFQITQRGHELLKTKPNKIMNRQLFN